MSGAAKKGRVPRALIICCEGKTEKAYFEILLDFYRPPAYVMVKVLGQKGQHEVLVDRTVEERVSLCEEYELGIDDVECWAVCDEDAMALPYVELAAYADERGIRLAFSAPQFEMFLLQHFEPSGLTDVGEVFDRLSTCRKQYDGVGAYDDSTKSDLGWVEEAIDRRPKIVQVAITNAHQRERQSKRPFFTTHHLVERILELGR